MPRKINRTVPARVETAPLPAERLILGENYICSTDCAKTGVNNNIIVCGVSGGGKTMSVIEPRLLETYSSSLVVTVTKRRLVHKYRMMFEERGYIVRDLNFADPSKSDAAYDPMAYVRDSTDITFLAKALVMSDPRKEKSHADPFWDETAISLLSAEIAMVRYKNPFCTFADVLDYHDHLTISDGVRDNIDTSHDDDFEELEREDPGHFAVTNWKTFSSLPIRTAGCVFGTLNTSLDSIFSPQLRRMIAQNDSVDFSEIASRRSVLFLTSSAVNPALNCFINMFYAQMFKQLFEFGEKQPDGRLPVPVSVLCDDFATGSCILNFPEYISIFREKGISVMLLIQSESQLSAMYGYENAVTIINNCDTYLYLGGNDLATGRNISQRINLPLDEVLYMPVGQEIVFRRGSRPVITQRYNILADENYCAVTEMYEKNAAGR